jgi:hypothetical protein
MAALTAGFAFAFAAQAAMPAGTPVSVRSGANYPGGAINEVGSGSAVYRLSAGEHLWDADREWHMYGIILVGNGAVLTIEPGTIVRGVNEMRTGVPFRGGMLVVERGGKIYANGTATNPIVFTDEWDNHFPWRNVWGTTVTGRQWTYRDTSGNLATPVGVTANYDYGSIGDHHGAWGGIVLCGRAFVNWDDMTTLGNTTIFVEGMDTNLSIGGGGNDDDDSSGELSFVQIRYGGSAVAVGKEINGLTMYGVGRGTKISHIEVYNNLDDTFEWFGGTVNSKYLVAWGVGDDVFDSDAGFRGKSQFLFGVQRNMGGNGVESGISDKGMEIDGYETQWASGAYLYSASLWANITLVGIEYTQNGSQNYRNVAISIRDNASPRIYNSIFMDFGSVAALIENRIDRGGLNATDRFTSGTKASDFPNLASLNKTTLPGGAAITTEHLYGDGAMADDRQACIRGNFFYNIFLGMNAPELGGTDTTAGGNNAYLNRFNWAGGGPFMSPGLKSYDGWAAVTERNVDYTASVMAPYMPITKRTRVQNTKTGIASYDITMIDPRPAPSTLPGGIQDPRTWAIAVPDVWLTPVRFVGAFDPVNNWAKGWTTIGTLKSKDGTTDIVGVFGATSQTDALMVENNALVTAVGGMRSLAMEMEPGEGGTEIIYVDREIFITNGVHGIIFEETNELFDENDPMVGGVPAINIKVTPQMTYTITVPGVYQLQTCDDLLYQDWQIVRTFTVPATAVLPLTVNVTDIVFPETAADRGFYRLLMQ